MKTNIIFVITIFFFSFSLYSQNPEVGTKFEFNTKAEQDARFVLKDNYNHYLFSVTNTDGMLRNNTIILRKFDQKNKLVQTFTYEFGPKDVSYLNNYLGSFESGNDKIIVITESYSKKFNKKDISKHVFDKSTSKFETSLIISYPIESLLKSGTTYVKNAENNNFIGINFVSHNSKNDPEVNYITMLDANGNLLWQKEVSLESGYNTQGLTITNSGKALLYRNPRGFKNNPVLTLVTAEGKEDKTFEPGIKIHVPKAISIGNKDYLIAFNYPMKGSRNSDFQDLLLYDLENGTILKNNRITEFNNTKNLQEVLFKIITIQNNEILVFAEAKSEIVVTPTFGAAVSWDRNYKYENASMFIIAFDGNLKAVKKLNSDGTTYQDFYRSYGLINIKGDFYINSGSNGIYALDASKQYDRNPNKNISTSAALNQSNSSRIVNQLVCYFPDSKRFVIAVMTNEKEMCLVNVFDSK